jgi:hypothetical protein
MDIAVFQAFCRKCHRRLLLNLDFYWWLICDCGYKERLLVIEEGEKNIEDKEKQVAA